MVVKCEKKLEKIMKRVREHELGLIELNEQLEAMEKDEEKIEGCESESSEMIKTMTTEYKVVYQKLLQAHKAFPDIFSKAEQEVSIHFFTPFK